MPRSVGIFIGLLAFGAAAFSATADSAEPHLPAAPSKFTVCADPANLPYSNRASQGFENRIAAILAADLNAELSHFWFAEHKGFIRRTLLDGQCDAIVSVPTGLQMVAPTRPYFTSSYVAVTRSSDQRKFTSFDDAWLKDARIGIQLVGNEGATTPPVAALSRRGFIERLTSFPMWAEDETSNPQGAIIDAVAKGEIDVAFVWGPFAGFFAKEHGSDLSVTPILGDPKSPDQRFVFPMTLAVRKADGALRDRLQEALDRHRSEIAGVLKEYGIPTIASQETQQAQTLTPVAHTNVNRP